MRQFGLISGFALAIASLGSVLAQDAAVIGDSNGIAYAIGGIGLDSREALRAKEGNYNLFVILSLKNGHYLGGAALTIRNQAGKPVLEVDAKGPWIFAKLPAGSYTIEAKTRGTTRSNQVVVGNKALKRVHLMWDAGLT